MTLAMECRMKEACDASFLSLIARFAQRFGLQVRRWKPFELGVVWFVLYVWFKQTISFCPVISLQVEEKHQGCSKPWLKCLSTNKWLITSSTLLSWSIVLNQLSMGKFYPQPLGMLLNKLTFMAIVYLLCFFSNKKHQKTAATTISLTPVAVGG